MQEVVADIEALGASMVIISPQLEKYTRQVAKKYNLRFSVLGDPGNKVAGQFGLVYQMPDDLRALYQKFGVDFNRFNGDDSGRLPMPGRFILDRLGTIIHADVHPDYTQRPEPADILNVLTPIVSSA